MNKMYKKYIERAKSIYQVMDDIMFGNALGEEFFDAFPLDVFLDEGGTYLLFSSGGKLYKTYLNYSNQDVTFEEPEEVVVEHIPLESRTRIFRINGELRFVSIAASALLNRVGQIDTMSLFDSMVDNWELIEEDRKLNFYHIHDDDFIFGDVLGIDRYKEFLIAWGTIDESKKISRNVEKAIQDGSWGLSIEFISLEQEIERIAGTNITKHTEGIFAGLAILKEEDAANHFTKIVA